VSGCKELPGRTAPLLFLPRCAGNTTTTTTLRPYIPAPPTASSLAPPLRCVLCQLPAASASAATIAETKTPHLLACAAAGHVFHARCCGTRLSQPLMRGVTLGGEEECPVCCAERVAALWRE
jgi:hypothetical protein